MALVLISAARPVCLATASSNWWIHGSSASPRYWKPIKGVKLTQFIDDDDDDDDEDDDDDI